ncbi:hypothetical protein DM02DRAFT_635408 [Periconia macrospinosa]|uniref:MOSC domain-containing protein n=1 Tax=Periconia macrospinosa TaxID=97972 RepID=A0A2V1D2W0_9PLEO|nr:hypothetical protein DM02DRAFT_635408 [Periconia macrospinosa]
MAFSAASQGAIILSIFFLPILTYLFWNRGSKESKKNLKQTDDKAKEKEKPAGPIPPPTEVTNIFIHPIKSCHGLSVKKAKLLPTGLDLDRQWMWVTYPDLKFLTIRNLSKMTLIRPSYDASTDTLTVTAPSPSPPSPTSTSPTSSKPRQFTIPAHPVPAYDPKSDTLTVKAPTSDSSSPTELVIPAHPPPAYDPKADTLTITAPLPPPHSPDPQQEQQQQPLQFTIPAHPTPSYLATHTTPASVEIWGKRTKAHVYDPSLTAPFNAFFGKQVRLVYKPPFDDDEPRALGSNGAEEVLGRAASTCFPDLMPVLIGCESSLQELNARLRVAAAAEEQAEGAHVNKVTNIGIERFRPNILVKGHEPWDEDRWKTVRLIPPPPPPPPPSSSNSSSASNPLLPLPQHHPPKGETQRGIITIDITQRCARCQVPNVDPETAFKHPHQPWNQLMKYRRVDEGITFKPCFGMLGVPRPPPNNKNGKDGGGGGGGKDGERVVVGEIEVGMRFEVVEVTGGHRYIAGF